MSRIKPILIGILILVVVVFVSIGAAYLNILDYNHKQAIKEQQTQGTSKYDYGEQGLPYGTTLSKQILEVTDQYVIFPDRVLKRFYEDTLNPEGADILASSFQSIPSGVKKHLMIIPWRIAYEPLAVQYSDDIPSVIDKIYDAMPEDVTTYDIYDILKEHSDEYIFFRKHDWWTPLGAYYAAQSFLEAQGIPMKPIDAYDKYIQSSFAGEFDYVYDGTYYREPVYYYLLKDGANWQRVTAKAISSDPSYNEYESPTIALSRKGTDIFIGGTFSHSILQGDAKNGKTLMIVGDSFAKVFAPWFTPYYESVYLINISNYIGTNEDFQKIFRDYAITDCIILQNIDKIGSTNMKSFMKGSEAQ